MKQTRFKYLASILLLVFISIRVSGQSAAADPLLTNCQAFSISLLSSSPAFTLNNGIYTIKACPGDSIIINAIGSYPSNNTSYHQSDSTTSFLWNSILNSTNSNYNYIATNNSAGIANIILTAIDTNNCPSIDTIIISVIIAPTPIFSGITITPNDTICQGDSIVLSGDAIGGTVSSNNIYNQNNITYIPDGSGVSYTSNIPITSTPGLSIQNSNDINISATIEHSYIGDLIIKITCPNGQSAMLKSYPGGGSCFLGEPIDNNSQPIPGLGYEYKWSNSGTTTMSNAIGTYSHNFTDISGASYLNANYLPPSTAYPANSTASSPYPLVTYLPETNFAALIGCPINGNWTLTITDNLMLDNGYIFNWGIELSSSTVSNYNQQIASQSWNSSSSIISSNGNNITVIPPYSGIYQYTYAAIDSFGCSFDTSINIQALQLPPLNLGNDTTLCGNQSITLNAGSGNFTQFWSTNSSLQHITIDSTGIGYDSTLVHVKIYSSNGCTNTDTIKIVFADCSGFNNLENTALNISIFPNPSNGIFTIFGNINNDNAELKILNITGSLLLQKKLLSVNGTILETIDISRFSKGIYFMKITYNKKENTTKIIIH